jgi:hypothetical protein
MVNPNPVALAAAPGPRAENRTGVVVGSASADTVTVVVAGTQIPARFLDDYFPADGDLVSVMRQDSSWLVLGRIGGQGGNEVSGGSFEDDPIGMPPTDWTLYNLSSISVAIVSERADAPGGSQVARVFPVSGGLAESYLYSPPISVVPGEQWALGAFVGADYDPGATFDASASLVALWFANASDLYPTTVSADTTVATLAGVSQLPPFNGMSGIVNVPAGAAVMRVALRSSVSDLQALEWDLVTARLRRIAPEPPLGVLAFEPRATSAGAVTTTETVAITTAQITFRPGRAYRVQAKGYVQSSVSGDSVRIRVKLTNTAGQGLIDTFSGMVINGANGMTTFTQEGVFRVAPGNAPINAPLVMTYVRQTGTGNVFLGATSANVAHILVEDIGPQAPLYVGARTIV